MEYGEVLNTVKCGEMKDGVVQYGERVILITVNCKIASVAPTFDLTDCTVATVDSIASVMHRRTFIFLFNKRE